MSFLFIVFDLIFGFFLIFYLAFLISELLNFVIRKIPPVPTSPQTIKFILETIKEKGETQKIFVDLGCGAARVLIAVKKKYPQMEIIGYENWLSQFLLAKIMLFLSRTKAKVFYKDLFRADLSNADIVYFYLYPHLIKRLEKKLEKELKDGALVVANTFPLPHRKPIKIIITNNKKPDFKKIFVYRKIKIMRNKE